MRNWTWLVLVASGGLAWACGGDDDGGNGDNGNTGGTSTTGSGGSGGTGGTGGSGGSGGTGGGTSTASSTTGTPGTTGTGGSTTSAGGMAGADAGGAAGDAGAAGADTGSGGTGGGDPDPVTIEEACAAACAAQSTLGCVDPGCDYNCVYASGSFPGCEEEYLAQQVCVGELEPGDFDCTPGYPVTAACPEEDAAFGACAFP